MKMTDKPHRVSCDVVLLAESGDNALYRLGRYLIQSAQGKKSKTMIDGKLQVGPIEEADSEIIAPD